MDTTYLAVNDGIKIEANVIDAATTEVVLTSRWGQCVVLAMTTPKVGQRFAVALSDAIYQAEKRGPSPMCEDDRKLDDVRAEALEDAMAYAAEDSF